MNKLSIVQLLIPSSSFFSEQINFLVIKFQQKSKPSSRKCIGEMDPYGVINGSLIHNGRRESWPIHIHSNQPVDGNNFGGVWPLTIPLADPENGCCPRQPNVPNTR